MAFPTIPTVAATRILTSNQADTTATRTFPSLTGLTKNAGDLLIAIIVAYQTGTGTNAAFSGWSAGWTEFHDSATSTTMAVGMAYKWSTGSETGTISVTQAGAITGYASMILLSIPGAHATTPPEAGGRASGTGAADPTTLTPSWGAADNLWIAVGGAGETASGGTWTGMGAAPTNFSGYADTAKADTSTVGETEAAVAFRQLNASSLDVGAFTSGDTSNNRDAAVVIAVRNAPVTLNGAVAFPITFVKAVAGVASTPPKSTAVAEVSLASHGIPSERTSHSIKIRARTTSGSTGVIKAALYEGATNRSGDLTSSALTNSLADYTLTIPNASAENITDYSNLSIRFWGYDSTGAALVFEVANIYLSLPESSSTTYYGAISQATTFAEVVSGFKETFGQIAAPFTFVKDVAGVIVAAKQTSVAEVSLASHGTPSERTSHSIKIRARTTTGSTGVIKAALYEGATNRSGDLTSSVLTNDLADYTLTISDAAAENITDYSNLSLKIWGYDSTGAALVFEVSDVYLELPEAGAATYYGAIVMPVSFEKAILATKETFATTTTALTFIKDINAQRQTFSQIVAPFTFVKAVSGSLTAFGQIVSPFTFVKSVTGRLGANGQIASAFTFTKSVAASRQTFGQTATPFVFVKSVIAQRTTFGQTVTNLSFNKVVSGVRTALGQIVRPFTFGEIVSGTKQTFGQIVRPFTFAKNVSGVRTTLSQISALFTFNKVVSAQRTTFSRIDLPLIFTDQTSGRKETFGNVGFPINLTFDVVAEVQGIRYGETSMSLVFGEDVAGTRKTFGQIVTPYLFERSIQSSRTTFGRFDRPFTFIKETIGRRETFGGLAFPINTTIVVGGTTSTNVYGEVALSLVFGEQTVGQRRTFGQIARPYNFSSELDGILEAFGSVDFPVDFVVNVNTGRVETFSSLGLEFLLSLETAGIIRPTSIILNLAKEIYLGSTSVDAVYMGSQKVWPE